MIEVDRSRLKVDENFGEAIEIAKDKLLRFRMEVVAKQHLMCVTHGIRVKERGSIECTWRVMLENILPLS